MKKYQSGSVVPVPSIEPRRWRDGANVVLGVNSYVTNSNCSGVGYSTRVDVAEVLAWINCFLQ